MVVERGEIWWAALPEAVGSEPGYRRPVVVVQADAFNRSAIATVIVVAITTNLRMGSAPGNVLLSARQSGLPKESVVNVSQVLTLDRRFLVERVGRLAAGTVQSIDAGLRRALDLGDAGG